MKSNKEKKLLIAYKIANMGDTSLDTVKAIWQQWYPDDITYFKLNEEKWESCCRWVANYAEIHNTAYIQKAIVAQRKMQKRKLNKALEKYGAHTILIKSQIRDGKLAMYLMIQGTERRAGSYSSLMAHIKSLSK